MSSFHYNEEALKNLRIEDTHILDSLIDFEETRRIHLNKEHAKVDKRMSIKEAVKEYIHDGDVMCDTGFAYVRAPIQSYFEVMRQGKKDIQMIGAPNTNQSYMIATGNVGYSHNSYIGAEMRGSDRNYSRQFKAGKVKILSEWSHGGVALGFKAGQLGSPGVFSKQMLGSDIVKYNPYIHVMQNPMKKDPDPVVFIPALYPDVAVIHVHAADKYGNAYIYGPTVNDMAVGAAAKRLIITAEEIVPENDIRYNRHGSILPFFYADAVVEMPYGALPGSMPGCYYWPRQWWEKTMRTAVKDDKTLKEYLDYWVFDCKDQIDFLDKLGGAKWMVEARRQTKAAEGDNEDIDFSYTEYTPGNDSGLYY